MNSPLARAARAWMWAWLAALAVLVLAWFDVVPGGYLLRECIRPRHGRSTFEDRLHAHERLLAFAAENASARAGSIVFLGSSTIERFPLADSFPGRACLNRGIASESVGELAARVTQSLPAARPAGFVLYGGSVDFHERGADPDAIVRSLDDVVSRIRAAFPGVAIALIGVLPRRDMPADDRARLVQLDAALRAFALARRVAYVSTLRPPITSSQGSLAEECSTDRYHLDARGYTQLARWILVDGGEVGQSLAP